MAAHNKPLREQNPDEAQAHLSTTRFHMQVAAPSSHRSLRVPDLPYQERARCDGGEITGSEQSARQRTTGHMTEDRPFSHTHAGSKYRSVDLPAGQLSTKIFSLQKGPIKVTEKARCNPPVRARMRLST